MARYYDLDSLRVSDINVGTVMFPRMERCILLKDIESALTADVVPKIEVDNLKVLLEMKEKAYEGLKELYDTDTEALVKAREKTEEEVAREIFEEIETCMKNFEDDDGYLLKKCEFEFFMRELKKEYAEEKE